MREFLTLPDLADLVAEQFGTDRRLVRLVRLTGGSKKGVYRLGLDDGSTVVLYVWAAGENYWPPSPAAPDDPFVDASGAELFAVSHAALTAAGVRVPRVIHLGRRLESDIALVEDVGSQRLDGLIERDPAAAAAPLAALGESLRRLHKSTSPRYGKVAQVADGTAPQGRRPEDIVVDRALRQLDAVAAREPRLAAAHDRIADHVRELRALITPRESYGLVHGELGPDHVFVTPGGEPVMIDFEGLAYFDVEWDHAWLRMRFGDVYPALRPVSVDGCRLEFYRYAQVLSLIDGPLRIADTDFPGRSWMLDLAEWNIGQALAAI